MPIQRYHVDDGGSDPSPDGAWCNAEDVAALEAERDALKATLAALEGQRCETCALRDRGSSTMATHYCLLDDIHQPLDHGCRAWKERTDG